ncbi:TPA: hypothetical protein ENS27_13340 [bacterium]|mgnify:CR=1 FL=1|nr:hypothetical protein [bacterium]
MPVETFYVRPYNAGGGYGNGSGFDYDNAFNGLSNIRWSNVSAGTTLYICDEHTDNIWQFVIGNTGLKDKPITIRGDYEGHAGVINPATKSTIVFGTNKYIKIEKLTFDKFWCYGDVGATDITIKDCIFTNQGDGWSFFDLWEENHNWTFDGCSFDIGRNGIYTHLYGTGCNNLVVRNCTFKNMGVEGYENGDSHAVGIQGGTGHIIEDNYIDNTGSAILFYNANGYGLMGNHIVRRNFIKNVRNVATGGGIVIFDTCTMQEADIMSYDISYNILSNCYGTMYLGFRSNKAVNVYNNTMLGCGQYYNASIDIRTTAGNNIAGVLKNNIIAKTYGVPYNLINANIEVSNNLIYDSDDEPIFVSATPTEPEHFVPTNEEYINAGVDLGQEKDILGNGIVGSVDIGAIEKQ